MHAGYHFSMLEDMARELGLEYNTLRRALIFFKQNRVLTPRRQIKLTWSHYLETLPIEPQTKRHWYEDAAQREEWTRDQLRSAIKREAYDERGANGKYKASQKLRRPTAATFVYKALVERVIDGDTLLLRIDLGFLRCGKSRGFGSPNWIRLPLTRPGGEKRLNTLGTNWHARHLSL